MGFASASHCICISIGPCFVLYNSPFLGNESELRGLNYRKYFGSFKIWWAVPETFLVRISIVWGITTGAVTFLFPGYKDKRRKGRQIYADENLRREATAEPKMACHCLKWP
jgi:hypothetical protein